MVVVLLVVLGFGAFLVGLSSLQQLTMQHDVTCLEAYSHDIQDDSLQFPKAKSG